MGMLDDVGKVADKQLDAIKLQQQKKDEAKAELDEKNVELEKKHQDAQPKPETIDEHGTHYS